MTPRQTLIVTGGHGFVAGSVIAQGLAGWQVHAVSRGEPLLDHPGVTWHRFDPLEVPRLDALFRTVRPQAVIHTAAIGDIDYCQAHPEVAYRVNVELTRLLGDRCAEAGAKLVFCSTDTVFDGERAPYLEGDSPAPVNYYGETKVAAEQLVVRLGSRGVVARLALVMGLPVLGAGNSFLARLVAALRAGREVGVPAMEIRTPIDVVTLGRALLELAAGPQQGLYHLSGNDRVNRLELSQRIAARFGLPTSLLVSNDPTRLPGRAPRPRDVSLDNRKAQAALRTPLLGLDDGLSLILAAQDPTGWSRSPSTRPDSRGAR